MVTSLSRIPADKSSSTDDGSFARGLSITERFAQQAAGARSLAAARLEARLADLQEMRLLRPDSAQSYIDLASCLAHANRYEAAIVVLDDGLQRCPHSVELHEIAISLLEEGNQTEKAIAAAKQARRLFPESLWFRLKEALLLPVCYASESEIAKYRARFVRGLARLDREIKLDSPATRSQALAAFGSQVNVALSYQGRNDVALQSRFGSMMHRVMAANYSDLVHPIPMPFAEGKLRIGYISARFRDVSATKIFFDWIRRLSTAKFETFAYHVGAKTDATTAEVSGAAASFRHLTGSIEQIAGTVRADQLHVLVFLDVGMKPLMSQLAALRLAPIQCASWDHPVTTGLPTIDYFISSEAMEPGAADRHYSETLVRLPGLGVRFRKPVIPRMLLSLQRRDFGLPEDAVVYLCTQPTYKYLPQHDDVFVEIARRVPKARFVFLTLNRMVAGDFQRRLDRAFSAAGLRGSDHYVLLDQMERFQYWNLHLIGDVFLDTIGWSGGVSTVEALACRLPVVTLPDRLLRANHSSAILMQMKVPETIARTKAEFVDLACRLGVESDFRERVKARIDAGSALFYADEKPIAALQDFFQRIVSEHLHSKPSVSCVRSSVCVSQKMSYGIGKVKHKNKPSYRCGVAR